MYMVTLVGDGLPLPASQGSPLPGCVYEHTKLFCRSIYGRCCSAEIYSRCCSGEIYAGDAILREYTIMCDPVLLEYLRAVLGLATPGSGDPKPTCLALEWIRTSISGPRPKKVVHHLFKNMYGVLNIYFANII